MRGALPVAILALLVAAAGRGGAEVAPLKPYGRLVDEVVAFLVSDVGDGGIRTDDGLPDGYPVPPYFYHYAIRQSNMLWSGTSGYPGYASISYPAYTACVAIDAFLDWRRYGGDEEGLRRARAYADWILEHRTPPGDLYGNLPYSTQTDGVMGGGWDDEAIMTDKPAMFGLRLLRLFDVTGEPAYWQGAREIAATLAATQLDGPVADRGRWPFRVRPADGLVTQDYTSHLQPAVRFFDQMATRTGDTTYAGVRDRAWRWLLANPCDPASPVCGRWEAFYEDQSPEMQTGMRDHYSAGQMIVELVRRRPAGWQETALAVVDSIEARYLLLAGGGSGLDPYVPCTLEWEGWRQPTYAASLQFAAATLRLHDALAGDPRRRDSLRDRALAIAAVCSHGQDWRCVAPDGRMFTTVRDIVQATTQVSWYEQDFNTVKYYLELMGLAPELAPDGESHLLRADRPLTAIAYPPAVPGIVYDTAGGAGCELLKVAAPPAAVSAAGAALPALPDTAGSDPGWHFDPAGMLLRVRHADGPVQIVLQTTGVDAGGTGAGGAGDAGPAVAAVRLAAAGAAPGGLRLRLELARAGLATVSIHDARGRLARELLAPTALEPGPHLLAWDGRDRAGRRCPSGVYLARATAGRAGATARLLLVR